MGEAFDLAGGTTRYDVLTDIRGLFIFRGPIGQLLRGIQLTTSIHLSI
jgi:hypothetical protein